MHDDSLSRRRSRAAIRSSSHGSHRLAGSCQSSRAGTRPAGALLPSARLTASAFGAALSGVIANGLGFDQMTRPDESKAAASWTFAGFRAAGIARMSDCVALQQPDRRRSPSTSTQAARVGCFVVAPVAHADADFGSAIRLSSANDPHLHGVAFEGGVCGGLVARPPGKMCDYFPEPPRAGSAPPAGRIAGGTMVAGPNEVRFAVKALPAAGARPNELTRTRPRLSTRSCPTTPSSSSTTTA